MTTSRRLHRSFIAAVAAIAVALGGVIAAAPAAAAVGGTVSGNISVELSPGSFGGATGFKATFYPLTGSGDAVASVTTNSAGNYTTPPLEQGGYRVHFSPINLDAPYVALWYGETPFEASGGVVTVGALNITGIDGTLDNGSTISGSISGSAPAAAAAFLRNPDTNQWERFSRYTNAVSGAYTIRGLPEGEYLIRFGGQGDDLLTSTEYWEESDFWYDSELVDLGYEQNLTGYDGSLSSTGLNLFRLSGADRFATSVQIADLAVTPQTTAAFVVNGLNFPDALSAGPAAAEIAAPVLLTAPDFLPPVVASYLGDLDLETIYVIGGPTTVSPAVEAALAEYASGEVVRIAGTDRFQTSRLVADYFWGEGGANTAYIATGLNFPDALGAGPAAANESGPVILVNGLSTSLDTATRDALDSLGVTKVVVAGSDATVSAAIESGFNSAPFLTEVYRRSGTDRFDTAIKVAKGSFRLADAVFFATGLGFPDALAGAALAGNFLWKAPIYLVQKECVPEEIFEEIVRLRPAEIYILGGEPSVGVGVAQGIPCS